jgi:potassium efflux system protein
MTSAPRFSVLTRLFQLLALLCAWTVFIDSQASEPEERWIQEARREIVDVQTAFEAFNRQTDDIGQLDVWDGRLSEVRLAAQRCIDSQAAVVERLKKNLDILVDADAPVPADTGNSSQEARSQLAEHEARLALCRGLLVDARSVSDQLRALQAEAMKSYLLNRGPNLWDVSVTNLQQADSLYPLLKTFLLERLQLNRMQRSQWLIMVVLMVAVFFSGMWWRQRILLRLVQVRGEGVASSLVTSLLSCFAAKLPLLVVLATIIIWFLYVLPNVPVPPSVVLLLGLLVYLAGSILVRTFLEPCPPAEHFLDADQTYCRALGKRLHGLLALLVIAVLVFGMGIQDIMTPAQWLIARAAYLSMAIVILLWLLMTMRHAPSPLNSRKLRGLIMLVLLASLFAELSGFRNLSFYLLRGLVGITLLASVLWVINVLLRELFDDLDTGRYQWQSALRNSLGLGRDEPVPGLIWLRLLVTVVIWLLFAAGAFALWGYSDRVWTMLREGLTTGFQVAGVQILPLNWVIAIAVFALLVAAVRWMRNEALPAWVAKLGISHGAKEAVITISGYVGIMLAALVGLSLAGFNFTSLAIVVGALSVGIGFGLQNIVNNFISGIILLFERPIRTGDWVVVGNTEGYVRRISIRSTQIETFDRADVIVPNSELISSQVTNWMLNDPWGRVTVPIGVAYGTDVERLRDLLLQVASEHPLVMKDGLKVSPPKVLFRGFGESSLDFELRCFIRLVDRRLDTLSELNFAIERVLREAGIQIPFPQRDLHVRSVAPSVDWNRPSPP